jgi:leucyl/phenylalanyl-tRNA--protein transferase
MIELTLHPSAPSKLFPTVDESDQDGLLAIGGQLDPEWLLDAYSHGIFPWPSGRLLAWWSPDPRAILELDALHVSRRLAKTCRSPRWQVTVDRDFAGVMNGCGTAQHRRHATWITPEMRRAYLQMHKLGFAHSVEVWHDGVLAGGTYGVALGAYFAAESMFYYVRDASKVALVHLVGRLKARGYQLLDIQQLTPHTASLGATEIPRAEFLQRLARAIAVPARFTDG